MTAPTTKKPDHKVGLSIWRWVGIDSHHPWRSPCGQPAAVQASYPAPLSNQGSNRAVPRWASGNVITRNAKSPTKGRAFNLAVREGFEPSIRCRIHTFQACSFSHSDTSPNFYFLKWLSEHAARASCRLRRWAASRTPHQSSVCCLTCSANTGSLRCCAGTGRNVRDRSKPVNLIFHLLPSFAQFANQLTKKMPFPIPLRQFSTASCKCSPLMASSSEP